jgi:butyrate kinase
MEDILALNPGSTSTKLALYQGDREVTTEAIHHDASQLDKFKEVQAQLGFRLQGTRLWARAQTQELSATVAIGGLLRSVEGGTYLVNERMLADARANLQGEHPSNLGCLIASSLAAEYGCQAYVVDPVSVDEFEPLARYSGHPLISRKSLSHALNIHAVARRAAQEVNKPLAATSFVVAHLGGGISVTPVKAGRIIDSNNAAGGGPFSPERTGTLPLQEFITLCFAGTHRAQEVRSLVMGKGGLVAYLGTNSAEEVEKRIAAGDTAAREVYEAMAYQIAKEIGGMATVLHGTLDAVVLTGGLAGSVLLTGWIADRTAFLGRLLIYPGEDEMRALAEGALRVLRGEEPALEY